jgi:hypothetical protein
LIAVAGEEYQFEADIDGADVSDQCYDCFCHSTIEITRDCLRYYG